MQSPWPSLRRVLWESRPLRQKLALGVWLSVVPISLVASLVALENAKRVVVGQLQQQLIWDAEQASSWLYWWDSQHLRTLQFSADSPAIRSLQNQEASQAMQGLASIFPNYSYSLIERNGALVHRSGQLTATEGETMSQLLEGSTQLLCQGPGRHSDQPPPRPTACGTALHRQQRARVSRQHRRKTANHRGTEQLPGPQ